MVNLMQYLRKLKEMESIDMVDEENPKNPMNYAPPVIQKKYKKKKRDAERKD